ncbi:MAG: MBL fold metallo-hydrolase [Paludibacteraceae bacterium]|nr:MBL fold metallo-hydrolase [Paludibacteraceae bacterium]
MMNIKTFYCNPYRECTYIVELGNTCFIIDPGMYGEKEEQRVLDYLHDHQLTPCAILITHYHPDHICGLECLQSHFPNLPIIDYQSKMNNEQLNNLQIEQFTNLQIILTPGHKEDAVCFYFPEEKTIFTGDTLFQESIGRTDLPGGDMGQLIHSLNELKKLPEDTLVYPGHGYQTTIGHEKDFNPYL